LEKLFAIQRKKNRPSSRESVPRRGDLVRVLYAIVSDLSRGRLPREKKMR